ncbi:hypothetical protein MUN82_01980 [Hymenobacter aerilatus]|uniref:Uncharacterized protein n=1 Tax=Hymenobacter aerilatus TaxID=2932251 RepID=A0A8T9T064_9BACT|nr:hypothetical protein [Hymenobacter aerilatus]UOR05880.1 hypothetical protein MUN82_01980 [Hymenobacter aerilatus]
MATRFAFIFASELKDNGLAFMHFNASKDRIDYLKHSNIISVIQAADQQSTERKLLNLVKEAGYKSAEIWEDKEHVARYRYIKK